MAVPTGFEPVTCPLGGGCSIQLSHGTLMQMPNPIQLNHSKVNKIAIEPSTPPKKIPPTKAGNLLL